MARNAIVINVDLRETRVALIEKGVIVELQIERAAQQGTLGNVVLGKVTRVLPGMQAAFIDVGQERAAFLHVEDLIRPTDFEEYLYSRDDSSEGSFRGEYGRGGTGSESGDGDGDDDDGGDEPVRERPGNVISTSGATLEAAADSGLPEPQGEAAELLADDDDEGDDGEEPSSNGGLESALPSDEEDANGNGNPESDEDDRPQSGTDELAGAGASQATREATHAPATSSAQPLGKAAVPGAQPRRERRGDKGLQRSVARSKKLARGRGKRRNGVRVNRTESITDVVREGDEVVVQISKEPIGSKGARVTSHISLPGRYVVYLPTVDHVGISRRIGSLRERLRLRKSVESIKPPQGGLIVRTVAEGLTKKQLKADLGYLIRIWEEISRRKESARAPQTLYSELDLVLKVARDLFTDEIETVVIDDREQYVRLARFIEMFLPHRVKDIQLYSGEEPIFDAYGIEDEVGRSLSRKVPLPSGGSLVVDQAEALTAIDVNTGRFVGKGSRDLEETAFRTNLEAVEEIAYQLRLRNIGGLVILDLIDMDRASNRERVWRALEQALARDKAKTTINRISELGLIEMTRKRTRESLGRMLHEPCFYCDGTGHIQSKATIAYEILRQIRRERLTLPGYSVTVNAHPAIVDFLKNEEHNALLEAERRYQRRIELVACQDYHIEQYDLVGR